MGSPPTGSGVTSVADELGRCRISDPRDSRLQFVSPNTYLVGEGHVSGVEDEVVCRVYRPEGLATRASRLLWPPAMPGRRPGTGREAHLYLVVHLLDAIGIARPTPVDKTTSSGQVVGPPRGE